MYGEEVPGKVKYYNIGFFVITLTIYWTFLRIFVFYFIIHFEFQFWETLVYIGDTFLIAYLFYIGPLRKRSKAQERASSIDFMDSLIKKGKKKPQTKMLGFEEVYEVDIDFENDLSLNKRLSSLSYHRYLSVLVQKEIENIERNHGESPEELYNLLEDLRESLTVKPEKKSTQNNNNQELELKSLFEETKKFEEQARELIKIRKSSEIKEILPFEQFDLKKSKTEKEFKDSIKVLSGLKYYYVKLYAKENFDDEKEEWDDLFIILPNDYKKVCDTHKDQSELDGWPVWVKLCYCFWTYLRPITKNMHLLYLDFSDKMVEKQLDLLTKISAKAMVYLELKVMDLWMNELIVRPERLIKTNTYLESKANTFERGFSDLIQDQANMDIRYSQFLHDRAQNLLLAKLEKYKRGIILVLCALIFVIIIAGILISIVA